MNSPLNLDPRTPGNAIAWQEYLAQQARFDDSSLLIAPGGIRGGVEGRIAPESTGQGKAAILRGADTQCYAYKVWMAAFIDQQRAERDERIAVSRNAERATPNPTP